MMKQIPTYEDEQGNRIVFIPDRRRGITHRVEVNKMVVGFLPREHKPTSVAASFFCERYRQLGGV
jgi:hypothetical protein